ncbi:uncharacterized protein F5891DRAFT_1186513 [Suillus fuscotomentosus]|uniref:Uncharacterized protein n=1 Tax=Suillus fuscotomentosus TaxID=1912939 RepID=A0AAD4EAJ1_9AGAM|nr:uncharacterized protein F5891DRAFT_1186513 [Suillus fuscotomentosus]KAG1902402.1 hypothetical protein F5891DRAFT_1186513 [Suillus fuscotomentosus]
MPLVTRSGRRTKAPPPPDYVRTYASKDQKAAESDADDNQQTCSLAGPKSVMNTQNQDRPHPRPKARPLPRSERSDPMTSSAEEDIFFSNFSKRSSLGRKKCSDVNEGPEVQLSDTADGSTNGADGDVPSAGLDEDGTSNAANEDSVTNHREQTAFLSDGECGGATATNEGERSDGECGGAAATDEGERSDGECGGVAVTNEGERDAGLSDGECGGTTKMNERETNEGERDVGLSDGECGGTTMMNERERDEGERDVGLSDGECGGTTMTNERERDAVLSDGECDGTAATNKQEKTAVASTTVRPRRSGAHKLYARGHESEPAESSDSDSDWAELEEKRKKAEHANDPARPFRLSANDKQKGRAVADDHGDNADADPEGCDEDQMSEDGDGATHKAGRLSKEGILKTEEFGKRVMAEATAIGKEFGKHRREILIEAGLATKATRKESAWNQHQAWFPTVLPPSKEPNLASWKVKQNVHYHAHPYKDPNHASLWKKIQHHWDSMVASPEDLSSRESSSLMTAVREVFVKSASYWYRTHGIHIAGITIYPGDEESGRQASGFFAGSNMVKALIDARQVDVKHLIDELTTILKYKDLEAAQAEGKSLSFLPPPVAVHNAPLLCNGKSARDRNCMVAPLIISEAFADAGHPSKMSNSRWMRMLDILYSMQLCIHDWPAGVPPPGPDFDLKLLSASQLRALVGPYLRKHLGDMYEAELGRDEDEDDAEKATMTKRKGKSKKSNENRRTRGTVVQEPDVILSIKGWTPRQLSDFAGYSRKVYSIPLVIDTDGIILHHLEESEKFIKDLPPHVTERLNTGTSRSIGASHSHQEASRLYPAAPCSDYRALRSNSGASRSQHGASRSIPPVPIHTDHDELLDHSIHSDESDDDLPLSSPPLSSPHATPQGSNVAAGRYQYNCVHEDIRRSIASETRKWTHDDYESAREADDIETGMVAARYRSRTHDRASMGMRSTKGHNHPKPYVRASSKARMGPAPNQNTTHLPSRLAVVPYSEGSPSSHQYASRLQPAHVLDRRLLPLVDEDEFEYN